MTAQAPAAPALPAAASTPVTRPRRVVVARRLAITALVAGSVVNAASSIVSRRYLDPEGTPAERFAAIDEHRLALGLALAADIVAILLMVLISQTPAHLVRARSPRLAAAGAGLTLVGAFGFLGIHMPGVFASAAVAEGLDPVAVDSVPTTVESSLLAGCPRRSRSSSCWTSRSTGAPAASTRTCGSPAASASPPSRRGPRTTRG